MSLVLALGTIGIADAGDKRDCTFWKGLNEDRKLMFILGYSTGLFNGIQLGDAYLSGVERRTLSYDESTTRA
jgi:hypothetical protein